MIIGVDLDGVLTPISLYTESKFPWFCALWLVFVPPRRKMIQKLEIWQKSENEIIIISARPKELWELTKIWLFRYKVPFDRLVLVGTGKGVEERKLNVIQEMGVEFYLDDNLETVEYLRKNGTDVRAYHFS